MRIGFIRAPAISINVLIHIKVSFNFKLFVFKLAVNGLIILF